MGCGVQPFSCSRNDQTEMFLKLAAIPIMQRSTYQAFSAKNRLSGLRGRLTAPVKGCRTPSRAGTPVTTCQPARVGVVQASGEETAGSTNLGVPIGSYGDLNERSVVVGGSCAA